MLIKTGGFMVWLIIFSILIFNFVIITMSSKCSRIEEKMYLKEFKRDIN